MGEIALLNLLTVSIVNVNRPHFGNIVSISQSDIVIGESRSLISELKKLGRLADPASSVHNCESQRPPGGTPHSK